MFTCMSRISRRVARERESECTTESSSDSSARIRICMFRVSSQFKVTEITQLKIKLKKEKEKQKLLSPLACRVLGG